MPFFQHSVWGMSNLVENQDRLRQKQHCYGLVAVDTLIETAETGTWGVDREITNW